jgi:hypothetical protein
MGVHNATVEDITVAKDGTQNVFWMPQTRPGVPVSHDVTVRNIRSNGTWADGINVHGSHVNVRVEGCELSNNGDDAYAIWSHGDEMSNITFQGNVAHKPRYPANTDGEHVSCYAVYGGRRMAFLDNVCTQTGPKGAINFQVGYRGNFSSSSFADVHNNSVDGGKPICGGPNIKAITAPGCHEAAPRWE